MTSNIPDCPVCTFPMAQINEDKGWLSCRSCGFSDFYGNSPTPDNRYENSIFEMPRDEFMKALEDRYTEGKHKGFLVGFCISIVAMSIVYGMLSYSVMRLTDDILDKAQRKQLERVEPLLRGKL